VFVQHPRDQRLPAGLWSRRVPSVAGNPAYRAVCLKSGVLPNMPEIGRITPFAGNRAYYQIRPKSGVLPNSPEIGRITKLAYDYGKIV
jgi:hypothetical protein